MPWLIKIGSRTVARTRRRPRVIKAVRYQRGRSSRRADVKRRAMRPGKRISRTGRVYWETRKNRSDLAGWI